MALKDQIPFGMSLPHRSPDPLPVPAVRGVARRADELGFSDLWVTENVIDGAYSFDPVVVLTYAAAITTRIRLGTSVVVLPLRSPIHVAHAYGSLDYISGGRMILGVGLGRGHLEEFHVPRERLVRRFLEQIELMRAIWRDDEVHYAGDIFRFDGGMPMKPIQTAPRGGISIWIGGTHPDALRRAASVADGWMGAGGLSTAGFGEAVKTLRAALEKAGRNPDAYQTSKRVFMSVHEDASQARREVDRWFTEVYHNPAQTETNGVYGTPEQVKEQIEGLIAMGANHLLLNPVCRYEEQVEALASLVGFV